MLHDQGSFAKNWVSPFKDAAGSGSLTVKMARDFGSWKDAQVAFSRNAKGHEIVTFKGWPNGRKIVRGTRYRVWATAVGTAAASVISGTAVGMALVGSFAMGPLAVGFLVGLGVGNALTMLDGEYHITDKLSAAYDWALAKLDQVWDALSDEAEARHRQPAALCPLPADGGGVPRVSGAGAATERGSGTATARRATALQREGLHVRIGGLELFVDHDHAAHRRVRGGGHDARSWLSGMPRPRCGTPPTNALGSSRWQMPVIQLLAITQPQFTRTTRSREWTIIQLVGNGSSRPSSNARPRRPNLGRPLRRPLLRSLPTDGRQELWRPRVERRPEPGWSRITA